MGDQNSVSVNVKAAYDECYEKDNDGWRLLGAKYKVQHIIDVCKGYTFNSILEVGAGDGSILKLLSDQNFAKKYSAVEISESGVNRIKALNIKGLELVQMFDGYHLPFRDDEFDLVVLSHVLEHVEHERLLLRELKRVAKMCLIEVPIDYKDGVDNRIKHFLAYGHINMYTPTSVRYLLLTEGFKVINDLTSMIEPEVTRFNTYINQKKSKSIVTDLKITAEYGAKKLLCSLFGKDMQEKRASAYTILCSKEGENLKIF
ncbi:class I SAM-dependent methyltransferase [Mucilaginibacter sp. HMF5004]|uniref:class I SAM-dependent methyltransferase n=1 Tax=Mucilaginibacter rivuli TaxID=2857527 RepID=UPI001C5F6883|nr:class I SAM-dependent methyltransferase [Mucilaginibacter rivuli]MBW4890539.1 class I SAM-dependent methyltransferase [Mucilaginibacter rivuli]